MRYGRGTEPYCGIIERLQNDGVYIGKISHVGISDISCESGYLWVLLDL